ncbi:Beta-1,4-galactosyltransferase 2 [Tyto alba]|uniref:Beta-1,4-galactosyltransferase 2 n=1 Tax=Tyto alba TaxID=56313 RepID=A0A093EPF1_TYTAL|nr:Beta-1,4-galactosyltransferase 2 [Tyto alba]
MTRLLLGVTLERICKAVLLLCLLHFVIIMILYFDVYAQHLDFFSRFNARNASRAHPFSNSSRPNGTVPSYGPAGAEAPSPSAKPSANHWALALSVGPQCIAPGWHPCPVSPGHGLPVVQGVEQWRNPSVELVTGQLVSGFVSGLPSLFAPKVAYGIYIINQFGEDTFNRAKLLNVGFLEALKDDEEYDCFIFSDVDLIPMDDRNLYRCYEQPRHFAVGMDKFGFRLPYAGYFGGVSGLSKSQFLKINGFPNEYWGWGGEDDDIFNR